MGPLPANGSKASDARGSAANDVPVAIGQWRIANAPVRLRTLLGSCVGIALHDRIGRLGGLAHIVLPDSRGDSRNLGKFADTAIPGMIDELDRLLQGKSRGRLTAKIAGGACMFDVAGTSGSAVNIGEMNRVAVERILGSLRIPIVARDLGGNAGRRLTFDLVTGIVTVRVPGGEEYEI